MAPGTTWQMGCRFQPRMGRSPRSKVGMPQARRCPKKWADGTVGYLPSGQGTPARLGKRVKPDRHEERR